MRCDIIKQLTVNTLTYFMKGDIYRTLEDNVEGISNYYDEREIIHKFIQTNRLHRRIIGRYADLIEMNCSAHRMLLYISREEVLPSQRELAERLKISPAAVANTIKKLETDGYVERTKAKTSCDSRANEITLTDKGQIAVTDSEKYFRYVDSAALKDFTKDDLDTLCTLLDKIQNNLHSIEDIPEIE